MTTPPDDRSQLEFLQLVQRLFDEGEFVATYKFALLVALVELSIERGDDTGRPLKLDLNSIAEKFVEQYWPHAAPYSSEKISTSPAVLIQNHGRQAAVIGAIAHLRDEFGTLARARNHRSWPNFIAKISRIVEVMPLWKLQTLRRQEVSFLYKKSDERGYITLLHGVAFNLRRFGALIQLLARNAWVQHIRSNPRNAHAVGHPQDLEVFLFGATRADLSTARDLLQEMQENRCFYCSGPMRNDPQVDHFIPWSRYTRDLAHNFVLAHHSCNQDKGDMLAAPIHLRHWVERNNSRGQILSDRLSISGFVDDLPATLQVARWAYRQAVATSAQLWERMKYTVNADRSYLKILA